MNSKNRDKYRKVYISKTGVIDFGALKNLYQQGLLGNESSAPVAK